MATRITIRCPKCSAVTFTNDIAPGAVPPPQPFASECPTCIVDGHPLRIVSTFRPDWSHDDFTAGWGGGVPHNGRMYRKLPMQRGKAPTPPKPRQERPAPLTQTRRILSNVGGC